MSSSSPAYAQMPDPKVVVAVGICACDGGVFKDCYNILGGVDKVIPVDVYVPGCAARPESIIDGVVKALTILDKKRERMEQGLAPDEQAWTNRVPRKSRRIRMSEQEKNTKEGEEKEPLMDIKEIEKETLLDEVTRISFDNWRLIQICATKVGEEQYEILYTFGKGYQWKNLRIHLKKGEAVSSITSVYEIAYLYENEIHDLYGIHIDMLNYDFGGKLFRTGVQYPFA